MGFFDDLFGGPKQKTEVKLPREAREAIALEQPLSADILGEQQSLTGRLTPFLSSPFSFEPLVQARQTAQRSTQNAGRAMGLSPDLIAPLLTELEGLDPDLRRQLLQLIMQRTQAARSIVDPNFAASLGGRVDTSTSVSPFQQGLELAGVFSNIFSGGGG